MSADHIRAVYRDKNGATYSCPVEIHYNKWMMLTSAGFQEIDFYFDDDIAGRLTFDHYRFEEPDGRLHIQAKVGNESSLQQLQRAAAKRESEQRTMREKARQQFAEVMNQPNPAKEAAVREANNYAAQIKRPRGKGAFIINGNGE